jgi:hypothetical protein
MYNTQPATTATQHKLSKNTHTMTPPGRWLSDAPSLKVSTIGLHHAMAHDLHNTAIHFFLHETNLFFILFIFILQAADQRAGRQQVCFFSEYLPFF